MVAVNENDPGYEAFAPPQVAIEVECVHCGQIYDSSQIRFVPGAGPDGKEGAWCCPTIGCDGLGFLFDIWPTDPEWTDEHGNRVCFFDDEEEADEEDDRP